MSGIEGIDVNMSDDEYEIYLKKNMALYDISYFENSFKRFSINENEEDTYMPPTLDQVQSITNYHYLAEEPLVKASEYFNLSERGSGEMKSILDVGAGLCGPARYFANEFEVKIDALEIQTDYCQRCNDLNEMYQLSEKISVQNGNFLKTTEENTHEYVISLLCFLHIDDKETLFKRLGDVTKEKGKVFLEDFYLKKPLTKREGVMLKSCISCGTLDTKAKYISRLQENGFSVRFEDLTERWTDFVKERAKKFVLNTSNKFIHGDRVYNGIRLFYDVVKELFLNGNLGGCRVYAEKVE